MMIRKIDSAENVDGIIESDDRIISKLEEVTLGAYLLPRILSDIQIGDLLGIGKMQCHHTDEEGHDAGWDWYYEEQKEKEKRQNERKDGVDEEPEDKKDAIANIIHSRPDKPHRLPWVAKLIWPHVSDIQLGHLKPYCVDEMMKIYRLKKDDSVSGHMDDDFEGPDQSLALVSILIYLNGDYTGGETVFNSKIRAKGVVVGGGIVFRHDLFHEGLAIKSGVRYVLKTDLFFRK